MKNTGIAAWVVAILFLFGYEWWALATAHQSLSRAVYIMTTAWPPLTFLIGMVIGGLAVHFWWYWNPKESSRDA